MSVREEPPPSGAWQAPAAMRVITSDPPLPPYQHSPHSPSPTPAKAAPVECQPVTPPPRRRLAARGRVQGSRRRMGAFTPACDSLQVPPSLPSFLPGATCSWPPGLAAATASGSGRVFLPYSSEVLTTPDSLWTSLRLAPTRDLDGYSPLPFTPSPRDHTQAQLTPKSSFTRLKLSLLNGVTLTFDEHRRVEKRVKTEVPRTKRCCRYPDPKSTTGSPYPSFSLHRHHQTHYK